MINRSNNCFEFWYNSYKPKALWALYLMHALFKVSTIVAFGIHQSRRWLEWLPCDALVGCPRGRVMHHAYPSSQKAKPSAGPTAPQHSFTLAHRLPADIRAKTGPHHFELGATLLSLGPCTKTLDYWWRKMLIWMHRLTFIDGNWAKVSKLNVCDRILVSIYYFQIFWSKIVMSVFVPVHLIFVLFV